MVNESKEESELQYELFLESLVKIVKLLGREQQDDVLQVITTIIVATRFDPELKDMYYSEFKELYTDFKGEEGAKEEIYFLTGRKELGSIERLKYLTMWYDKAVKEGLYEGSNVLH
tara:strand:- start:20134 stop:20481 length:348 start_codon:yes stop_codon:yes gene_type:complete